MFYFPVINKRSLQAVGLRYCWPFFGQLGQELVGGAHATVTANPAVAGPQLPILTPAYNGTTHYAVANINLGDVNTLSIAFWLYWDVNGSGYDVALEYTLFADQVSLGGGNGFYLIPDWGDPNQWMIGCGGSSTSDNSWITTRPSAATWHHFIILLDRSVSPNLRGCYVDGQVAPTTYQNNNPNTGNFRADSPIYFMARSDLSLVGAGRICDVRLYPGKLLSAAEAWALYDPRSRWELYVPEERRVWSLPTTAAAGVPRHAAYYRQRRAA